MLSIRQFLEFGDKRTKDYKKVDLIAEKLEEETENCPWKYEEFLDNNINTVLQNVITIKTEKEVVKMNDTKIDKMNEIRIVEVCTHENGEGIREIIYNTKFNTLIEALKDYEDNFQFDNMVDSGDDFEEECEDSRVIGIEFIL